MAKLTLEQITQIYNEFKENVRLMYRTTDLLIAKVESIDWDDYVNEFIPACASASGYEGPIEDLIYEPNNLEEYLLDKLTDKEVARLEGK